MTPRRATSWAFSTTSSSLKVLVRLSYLSSTKFFLPYLTVIEIHNPSQLLIHLKSYPSLPKLLSPPPSPSAAGAARPRAAAPTAPTAYGHYALHTPPLCAACLPLPACALLACRCLHARCAAAARRPRCWLRCRRRPRAAAPPSRRMRSVQSLTGEEVWPVVVQYFESIIKC